MPLSWNEIRDRATRFAHDWADETSEDAEAKSFWDAFFNVFGVPRRRVASFERPVKKSDGRDGYIDLLWKGLLLVEHKSRGRDLDRAVTQAKEYFPGLKDRDLPRYILVSDFEKFRLHDLEENTRHDFLLKDLPANIKLFGFIAGYQTTKFVEQDPVNVKAAEKMGRLHDRLKEIGYDGHALEVYLVRLLFCLFAEDAGVFERSQFQEFIEQRTAEDGSDLAPRLAELFGVLNTPDKSRLKNLDEQLAAFRYVNGELFAEPLPVASFDRDMREKLLECCALDWSRISPAIFGAMFQSIMDKKLRRHLGAHYTSEKNIMKVIGPLFLDDLKAEFESVKNSTAKLKDFHRKLASLKFLDPACGCGNFLIIAYREIREIELNVLRILLKKKDTLLLDIAPEIHCNVDQFYGIEIEEFPAQIARTAMWLMDHQMNMKVGNEFGRYVARLPLTKKATIVHGNALEIDWADVVKPTELNYIFGNPPFVGKQMQTSGQKAEMAKVFFAVKGAGVLDFVAAWYIKAAKLIQSRASISCAFVSTNSITQGEQVGVLWRELFRLGVVVNFAHRTFNWTNEAKGKAAVHCVIIGFSNSSKTKKTIFDYARPDADPHGYPATNINPYLVDAPNLVLMRRSEPLTRQRPLLYGNKPVDAGHLIFDEAEKNQLLEGEPAARKFFRRFIGAEEFLYNIPRYCLWLECASPAEIKSMPAVLHRLEQVRLFRKSSQKHATRQTADTPMLFAEIRQPKKNYLAIPEVSSERRDYLPVGYISPDVISSNLLYAMDGATIYDLGIMSSSMHMAWVRAVCGRLESRYRYSAGIVYNNFPWPEPTKEQKAAIEKAAQGVLDARDNHKGASLADLYDPNTMPPDLVKAHRMLDAAVDAAYSKKKFSGDSDRVAFLFALYQKLAAPLDAATPKKPRRKKQPV